MESKTLSAKSTTIEGYIKLQPAPVKKKLEELLAVIRKAAPGAEEVISYGMPGFKHKGMLVWFAAAKNHFGFYARPGVLAPFEKERSAFTCTKSATHFLYDKPVPAKLVTAIVKEAIRFNEGLDALKKKPVKKLTVPAAKKTAKKK